MAGIPERLLLHVVTPERSVVREEVDEVVLPGTLGSLGALPGHTPLLTSLRVGELRYRAGSATRSLCVTWGFAEILPDRVTVLVNGAETPEEIDQGAAREAKEREEQNLRRPGDDFQSHLESLEHALARLQVASTAKRT